MGWHRPVQERNIKARIRRRDRHQCVVCRIDEQTYEKRHGKILDVHRIVAGSDYSIELGVCVTLCELCHTALHGKGHWGWIATGDPDYKQNAARLRRCSYRDLNEEESWRMQEAWGAWLKGLRSAKVSVLFPKPKLGARVRRRKRVSPVARFAQLSGLSATTILDFEAGRRQPLLFEAKKLAAALNISLDELATEKEPDEWQTLCEQRSHLKALVFRAREPKEGEVEALCRAARHLWEHVGREDDKRAEEQEAARRAEEARAIPAKPPVRITFGRAVSLKPVQKSRSKELTPE